MIYLSMSSFSSLKQCIERSRADLSVLQRLVGCKHRYPSPRRNDRPSCQRPLHRRSGDEMEGYAPG
jgi:hypothetical protein